MNNNEGNADDTFTVSVPVTNTGNCRGKEIVQLYISDPKSSLDRPVKELKGFSKIDLEPGETRVASFTVSRQDLSFFDPEKHEWVCEPGEFQALVGASSADIRSKVSFKIR